MCDRSEGQMSLAHQNSAMVLILNDNYIITSQINGIGQNKNRHKQHLPKKYFANVIHNEAIQKLNKFIQMKLIIFRSVYVAPLKQVPSHVASITFLLHFNYSDYLQLILKLDIFVSFGHNCL